MRTRPALAIALLALGPGAATLAAQLPAQEVEFLGISDPYPAFPSLATRTIAHAGGIYAVRPNSLETDPSQPYGVAGFFADFPSFGIMGYATPHGGICASSNQACVVDTAINQSARAVGGEFWYLKIGMGIRFARPIEYRYSGQDGTYLESEYLATPPGYPTPPTDGAEVIATAINDGDVIAGWGNSGSPAVGRAPLLWPSPSALAAELPRIPGANAGPFPARINIAGVIIGNTAGSAPERAAVWKPSYGGYSLALLGELPGGTSSRAYDIGFFGGIVGRSDAGSGTPVAVVWQSSSSGYSVTPLPVPLGGTCSAATAINTNGDIAGNCTTSAGAERGVVWRKVGGTYELLHELEPLPGHARSIAYALDNDGQAGGGSGPLNAERAVLWPVVAAAPIPVPALSHGALLCLAAAMAVAAAVTLRAR